MITLTLEQELFIQSALDGHNVLVDACIGSGKTTAIQALCDRIDRRKNILYLTYNKLLKQDARAKIRRSPMYVTNYHGFAWQELSYTGVRVGVGDCIQEYLRRKPATPKFDVLVLDEYQDLEQEFADMLLHIKNCNPGLQIIAVGDMAQKIYDKTRLDAAAFIHEFMGQDLVELEFTSCFRISSGLADMLSHVWCKKIIGCNPDCDVRKASFSEAFAILSQAEPGDILCLGPNKSPMRNDMQNQLEESFPEKFNKGTVWSRVSDGEGCTTAPQAGSAVFTTYDGCKGMERNICVVFDWTQAYWETRVNMPEARYEIIRNIFCVAASRGKHKILFVGDDEDAWLKPEMMKAPRQSSRFADVKVSGMFDFKYIEDVERAYGTLKVTELEPSGAVIDVPTSTGYIDLSFCLGIYQEAAYFKGCSVDRLIEAELMRKKYDPAVVRYYEDWDVFHKILYLAFLETGQARYLNQVPLPFMTQWEHEAIVARLATKLPRDARVQKPCSASFSQYGSHRFDALGVMDVTDEDEAGLKRVWELKFVSELSHTHFLQCAFYVVASGSDYGLLWNVRDGKLCRVEIPDPWAFLDAVSQAVTKGSISRYSGNLSAVLPPRAVSGNVRRKPKACLSSEKKTETTDRSGGPFKIDVSRKPYDFTCSPVGSGRMRKRPAAKPRTLQ